MEQNSNNIPELQSPFEQLKEVDADGKEWWNSRKSWIRISRGVAKPAQPITLQTYIRNYFHHPENDENARYTYDELKLSIAKMVEIAETI